jgi:hypothetical protein
VSIRDEPALSLSAHLRQRLAAQNHHPHSRFDIPCLTFLPLSFLEHEGFKPRGIFLAQDGIEALAKILV